MDEFLARLGIEQLLTPDRILSLVRAVITLVVGYIFARLISSGAAKMLATRTTAQEGMLLRRVVYYTVLGLVVATTLHQLGFKLSVLIGAAGVLTVAVGFASQTSASNIISGLFLIAERPFQVGDIISADGTTGEVLSIDLLSVKVRTFDNLFVRLPNEKLIKSSVTTLSKFPIRRADIQLSVAYKEDLSRIKEILFAAAKRNPIALDEPVPLLIFKAFGESGIEYQFSVWAQRQNFLALKTGLQEEIKRTFDEEGIEIPFPHRTLYTGSATEPLPVTIAERPRGDGVENSF